MRLGLIGYGAIGRMLVRLGRADPALRGIEPLVLLRSATENDLTAVHDVAALVAARPDLVVECAGHSAVAQTVPTLLEAGIDTCIASVGALADAHLAATLDASARRGGARLILPAGAIGGIDLLSALRSGGLASVSYEGRKPPAAWRGSAAEQAVDLASLTRATPFFTGTAREAALHYPKNANVAAALALAGVGFDATTVTLVADPAANGNQHSYTVTSGGADYTMQITGKPTPDNPRTSVATVYSLLREIRNRIGPFAI